MSVIINVTAEQADKLLKYATEEFDGYFTAKYQNRLFTVFTSLEEKFVRMYKPMKPTSVANDASIGRYYFHMDSIKVVKEMIDLL